MRHANPIDELATAWNEGETELGTTTSATGTPAESSLVPGLTVLAHPDARRVGEIAILPSLALGREVELSRLRPAFRPPGGAVGPGHPLAERSLSRQPIRIVPDVQSHNAQSRGAQSREAQPDAPVHALTLDPGAVSTPVEADGRLLEGPSTFSAAELERGIVLLVGRRVALLLGLLSFPRPLAPASRHGLVGESGAVLELLREIERLAPVDAPILLRGETGTGKELVAHALHAAGPRREGPWVAVNMATLAPSLAAAELFGAVRGAYTGAGQARGGFFQAAAGGTLFLDEIGETPAEVQPMLLRALESYEIVRVGSAEATAVDARVIAATDARLEEAMAEGRFRAPLYHRLAGYTVKLPPLRRRRDDIGRLLEHFLARETVDLHTSPDGEPGRPPARTVAGLARHGWPGNVRELRNAARRLALHPRAALEDVLESPPSPPPGPAETATLPAATLPPSSALPPSPAPTPVEPRRRLRRRPDDVGEDELLAALEEHGYRIRATAEALGLSRIGFYRRLEASPNVRQASELDAAEIEDAVEKAGGDAGAAARALRVSAQGFKRRRTLLGKSRSPRS